MRTKLICQHKEENPGYEAGGGNTELYEYECPCGKGKIVETHDNIPGFREHDVIIYCERCSAKYELDTSEGVRNWKLILKKDV